MSENQPVPTLLTIVMPVYNEAAVIESVILDYDRKVLERLPGSRLIVAEDGSTDGTSELLRRLAPENSVYAHQ